MILFNLFWFVCVSALSAIFFLEIFWILITNKLNVFDEDYDEDDNDDDDDIIQHNSIKTW